MPGTLFVVATPIGNLDDITLRALRVLGQVALIAAEDTRRTAHLLARHGISTATTSLHEHNEQKKSPALVARLAAGDDIALVSDAGTPTVSDPGARLVRTAIEAGIRVEPIPGPSAAVTALSASGFLTDSFTFLGFPPTRSKDRKRWFDHLASCRGVAIFYESPHRIARTIGELTELLGDKPGLLARELTKTHEELVIGPIHTLLGRLKASKGEFTVLVDLGDPPLDAEIIGHKPEIAPANFRDTVVALADQLGVPSNELYRAIVRLKNIGEMTDTD